MSKSTSKLTSVRSTCPQNCKGINDCLRIQSSKFNPFSIILLYYCRTLGFCFRESNLFICARKMVVPCDCKLWCWGIHINIINILIFHFKFCGFLQLQLNKHFLKNYCSISWLIVGFRNKVLPFHDKWRYNMDKTFFSRWKKYVFLFSSLR